MTSWWWSVGSAATVFAVAGALALRAVNPRTSPRFRAALIDAAVCAGALSVVAAALALPSFVAMLSSGVVWWPLRTGSLLVAAIPATVYLLLRDSLHLNEVTTRSLGKRSAHLRVAHDDGRPTRLLRSAYRNSTLLPAPLLLLPELAPAAAAALLVEIALVWRDPNALRLGDRLAGTRVLFRSRHSRRRSPADPGSGAVGARSGI